MASVLAKFNLAPVPNAYCCKSDNKRVKEKTSLTKHEESSAYCLILKSWPFEPGIRKPLMEVSARILQARTSAHKI